MAKDNQRIYMDEIHFFKAIMTLSVSVAVLSPFPLAIGVCLDHAASSAMRQVSDQGQEEKEKGRKKKRGRYAENK